jgi:hypothetical protein
MTLVISYSAYVLTPLSFMHMVVRQKSFGRTSPDDASPDDASPDDAPPDDPSPGDAPGDDPSPGDASPDDPSPAGLDDGMFID